MYCRVIAPRFKSWNLRSGISSPKPTGCCLGDLEADLKIALLLQIGQSTVIFWWFDGITVEDQEIDVFFSHPSTTIRSSWPKSSSKLRPCGWMFVRSHFIIYFFKVFFFFDSGPALYYFLTRDPLFIIVDVRSHFIIFFFKVFFFFFFFFHSRTAHYHSRTAPSSFSDCALCKWRTQLMYANGA